MGAVGTLLAGTPDFANRIGMDRLTAMRGLFWLYAAIGVVAALLYSGVSETHGAEHQKLVSRLGPSRMMVYQLTALFCVDSFGGGFLVQSILALWLFEAFHLPVSAASSTFFWTNILTTVSYFAAVPISGRFDLVNTMVFTPLPANICLLLIPFMPKLAWVITQLLLRSLLSQMDVPTRTVLRDGGCDPCRTAGSRRSDGCVEESRFGDRTCSCRLPPRIFELWLAVLDRRKFEGCLLPHITGGIPAYSST
jgi:hypothetical protein